MLIDCTACNIFLFTAHYLIVNLLPISRLVFLRLKGLRRTLLPLLSIHVLCHLELLSLKGPSLVNKIQVISSWYLVIFFLVRILTSRLGLYHTGLMWEGYGTCACSIMLCFWHDDTFCIKRLLVGFRDFGLTTEFRDFRWKGERESGLELWAVHGVWSFYDAVFGKCSFKKTESTFKTRNCSFL